MNTEISEILQRNNPKFSSEINYSFIETPLGEMLAFEFEGKICLLEFTDTKDIEKEIAAVAKHFKANFKNEETEVLQQLEKELSEYFQCKRKNFDIPLTFVGTDFQQTVWKTLQQIPYAETQSYLQQSNVFGNPKAIRAVASANGRNKIAVIVPCHRVIGSNGKLTGYAGGIWRKEKLLQLEQKNK